MSSYNDPHKKYHEQSSQSDIQEVQQEHTAFRITSNPGQSISRPNHKYEESSESDISSLSEDSDDDKEQTHQLVHNKRTLQVGKPYDSESDSEESSGIDLIEQRIKRLEIDLQAKIDRQKKVQVVKVKQGDKKQEIKGYQVGKAKSNGSGNPPLPPHRTIQHAPPPVNYIPFTLQPKMEESSENKNKLNFQQSQVVSMTQTSKPQAVEIEIKNRQPARYSPKKKESKKDPHGKSSSNVLEKSKGSTKPRARTEQNSALLLTKAHKQIDEMQAVIEQLRHQNHGLKEQLGRSKKKNSCEQAQKLKSLTCGDLKLQKQIQTLKAIEALQVKLRKSIGRKMKVNGGSMQLSKN